MEESHVTNVRNEWRDCVEHANVESPVSTIRLEEVKIALKYMKRGKTSEPTGVVIEILWAEGKSCLESLKRIFNEVVFEIESPGN